MDADAKELGHEREADRKTVWVYQGQKRNDTFLRWQQYIKNLPMAQVSMRVRAQHPRERSRTARRMGEAKAIPIDWSLRRVMGFAKGLTHPAGLLDQGVEGRWARGVEPQARAEAWIAQAQAAAGGLQITPTVPPPGPSPGSRRFDRSSSRPTPRPRPAFPCRAVHSGRSIGRRSAYRLHSAREDV